MQKYEREKRNRLTKVVRANGYAYTLVEVTPEERVQPGKKINFPLPCFMGNQGFALKSCERINK